MWLWFCFFFCGFVVRHTVLACLLRVTFVHFYPFLLVWTFPFLAFLIFKYTRTANCALPLYFHVLFPTTVRGCLRREETNGYIQRWRRVVGGKMGDGGDVTHLFTFFYPLPDPLSPLPTDCLAARCYDASLLSRAHARRTLLLRLIVDVSFVRRGCCNGFLSTCLRASGFDRGSWGEAFVAR